MLKRYGLRYKPRAVVWQLYEGNDLEDAERFKRWRDDPAGYSRAIRGGYARFSLLVWWINKTARSDEPSATMRYPNGVTVPFVLWKGDRYSPDAGREWGLGLQETKRAIAEGRRICAENGIELLILSAPIRLRVLNSSVQFPSDSERNRFLPGGLATSPDDFGAKLGRFCEEQGVGFKDLCYPLSNRAARDPWGLYFNADPHWDEAGNVAVADEVIAWLRSAHIGPVGAKRTNHLQPLGSQI